jgi:hypothetical protein
VYIEQPSGFEDEKKPNHVYKLRKVFLWFKANTKSMVWEIEGLPTL